LFYSLYANHLVMGVKHNTLKEKMEIFWEIVNW